MLAETTNGEDTVAPFEGEYTLMACAGTEKETSAKAANSKVFITSTSSNMAVHAYAHETTTVRDCVTNSGGNALSGFLTKRPTVLPHCRSNLPAFDGKDPI